MRTRFQPAKDTDKVAATATTIHQRDPALAALLGIAPPEGVDTTTYLLDGGKNWGGAKTYTGKGGGYHTTHNNNNNNNNNKRFIQ